MREVTRKTFDRKVSNFEWEVMYEMDRFNKATVRCTKTNREFVVRVNSAH